MIEILQKAKNENYFKPEAWAERGLNPSDDDRQDEMRQVIFEFIDIAIEKANEKGTLTEDDIVKVLLQLKEGIYDDFDTEEREWVYETCVEIAGDLGLNTREIYEKEQMLYLEGGMGIDALLAKIKRENTES